MDKLSDQAREARRTRLCTLPRLGRKAAVLVQHWLDIAGNDLVPARADLDPSRLVPALANIAIHRFESADRIMIRLAGTKFYHAYGREITGSNYLDLVGEERREPARERLTEIIGHPCGLHTSLDYTSRGGAQGTSESLGLPLVGPDGAVDMAIYVNDRLPHQLDWETKSDQIATLTAEEPVYLDIGAGIPNKPPPV